MNKEQHLKEYRRLVERNEKAAASFECSAQMMADIVKAQREITEHQEDLAGDLNELSKGFALLLNRTSIRLMEKNIHQLVDEHKEQEERGKKFNPGVPKKILKKAG